VQAFERDPFFRHCLSGSDQRYRRQLPSVFRMLFGVTLRREGQLFGVRSNGNLVGAVALENPNRPLRWGDLMRSPRLLRPFVELALLGGPRGLMRLDRWDRGVRTLRPGEPHHYVLGLGVLPQFQGQGFGGALMERLHRETGAHSQAVGIGLDTYTDKNVSFYGRLGYEVTGTVDIGGFEMHCMFRPSSPLHSAFASYQMGVSADTPI